MRKSLCGAAAALGVALVCVCAYTLNAQNYTPANTAPMAAQPSDGVSALIAPPASPVQSGAVSETSSEPTDAPSDASAQGASETPSVFISTAPPAAASETLPPPAAPDSASAPEVEVMGQTTPKPDSLSQSASQSAPDSGSAAGSAGSSQSASSDASSQTPPQKPESDSSASSQKPESGSSASSQKPESGSDSAAQSTPPSSSGEPENPPVRSLINPLTGLTLAAPLETRPVAVMIDNVQAALPQRGLQSADIVYESVTEGGVTRLAAVYADGASMPQTGPVCAARDQFLQLLLPVNAACVHVGSSEYARALWAQYPQAAALDGATQPALLMLDDVRKAAMSIEYCWFTSGALAAAPPDGGQETPPVFHFAPETRALTGGAAQEVYVRFSGYANSAFSYDGQRGVYVKSQFGAPHIDENTGEALTFDNLLILFADESRYPDSALTKVDFAAGGEGYYICGGQYETIHWSKAAPDALLTLTAADGTALTLNRGRTYIATVGREMAELFQVNAGTEQPQEPAPDEPAEPSGDADSSGTDTPPEPDASDSGSTGGSGSAGDASDASSSSQAESGADAPASSEGGASEPQSAADAPSHSNAIAADSAA